MADMTQFKAYHSNVNGFLRIFR